MMSHDVDYEQRIRMGEVGGALSKIEGSEHRLIDVRQGFLFHQLFV